MKVYNDREEKGVLMATLKPGPIAVKVHSLLEIVGAFRLPQDCVADGCLARSRTGWRHMFFAKPEDTQPDKRNALICPSHDVSDGSEVKIKSTG